MSAMERSVGMGERSKGLPDGGYLEVTADRIGEGAFLEQINHELQLGMRELADRRRVQTRGGCKEKITLTITAKVKITLGKDSDTTVVVAHAVARTIPAAVVATLARAAADGTLVAQPEGTSKDPPEQLRIYDAMARPTGEALDTVTGEVVTRGASDPIPIDAAPRAD